MSRRWGLSVFEWALWFDTGKAKPHWEGGGSFSWHPLDWLFGRKRCDVQFVDSSVVNILIPGGHGYEEASYPAKVTHERFTHTRSRLPFWKRVYHRRDVEVEGNGVPHPGKGTCSHNCGETGMQSCGGVYATNEEAVAAFVRAVMDRRERYPL